jgi:hypothetical protein
LKQAIPVSRVPPAACEAEIVSVPELPFPAKVETFPFVSILRTILLLKGPDQALSTIYIFPEGSHPNSS